MTGNKIGLWIRNVFSSRSIVFCLLFSLYIPYHSFAQNQEDNIGDQIAVLVEIKNIGSIEMPAIIRDQDVYLPVNLLFDFLKVKNTFSVTTDSLSGFYVNQKDVYLIDKVNNRISIGDTVFNLTANDLLKDETNIYLKLNYFKPIFTMDGVFNFRRLAVTFSSDLEYQVVREARQETIRRNISKLKGEVKADTTIKRTHPMFHFGNADWAITSTQQSSGTDETRFTLGLGAMALGGEVNTSFNYYTKTAFDEKQQYYQWRYVNNDNTALRQIVAGTIYSRSTSTLYAPVVGVQFTNAATTYRKSYGSYTLSNTTDPGWVVELYVNGVLIDYKKADASGFYTFDVPLIYGYSIIKLRFYGPNGEERTSQSYINIPFNFMPVHECEYVASAGVVEDGRNSIFSRVAVNYGLSNSITIGGGTEYLSSVTSGANMPFLNTSVKLAPRLLLSGEYTHTVRKRAVLNYRLPTNLQVDLDYTKYDKGQTAIYYNYLEERKAIVSLPIHSRTLSIFTRFTVDQIVVPTTQYTNAELAFTGTVKTVGLNYSNYASFVHKNNPYFYGLFSVSFTLPKKVIFTAQLQYDYRRWDAVFMKYTFEKHLWGKGYASISYQEFFNNTGIEGFTGNYRNILLGLRYDFSFARVSFSSLNDNNHGYTRVEAASGSFINDHKTNYFNVNNRTNVGKAGISLEAFLDINCNGKRDAGEPRVGELKVQMNGGRIEYNPKDSITRIFDLEPYVKYYIELNRTSFDNISWQIKNRIIAVTPNPNYFTLIEVPVFVVGEVSGTVSYSEIGSKSLRGEKQIILNVYDTASRVVAHTISESDGYFSYIGLPPGDYTIQVDSTQLSKLHLKADRQIIPVHLSASHDGDIVDGIEFVLRPIIKDTIKKEPEQIITKEKDTVLAPVTPIEKIAADNGVTIIAEKGSYTIQVCAVHKESNAIKIQESLIRTFKKPVAVVHKGSYYKPRIIGFKNRKEAVNFLPKLVKKGRNGCIVVKLLYPIIGHK